MEKKKDFNHEAWNEEMAKKYNPDSFIRETGFIVRWVESNRLKETKKMLACESESCVLDLGCGAGNLLEILDKGKITGIDLSDTLLSKAKDRVKSRENVHLIKANAESIPAKDNSFDRIACSEVLEHVQDIKKVLSEIHRVAKPNARIVITIPNESLIHFSKKIVLALGLKKVISGQYNMSDNMLEEWHLTEIDPDMIQKECEKDFNFEKKIGVPFPFLSYHRILVFTVKKTS